MLDNNDRMSADGTYQSWKMPDGLTRDDMRALEVYAYELDEFLKLKADPEEVVKLLYQLKLSAKNPPKHDETEWKLIYRTYAEDLYEFPQVILEEAIREWRVTEGWWPSVADLFQLCQKRVDELRRDQSKAEYASKPENQPKPKWKPPAAPPTDEEKEKVRALVQQTAAAMRMGSEKKGRMFPSKPGGPKDVWVDWDKIPDHLK